LTKSIHILLITIIYKCQNIVDLLSNCTFSEQINYAINDYKILETINCNCDVICLNHKYVFKDNKVRLMIVYISSIINDKSGWTECKLKSKSTFTYHQCHHFLISSASSFPQLPRLLCVLQSSYFSFVVFSSYVCSSNLDSSRIDPSLNVY